MTADELRMIFSRAGAGYLFDFADDPAETDAAIRRDLASVEAEYTRRYGEKINIVERLRADENGSRAFVQALGAPMSTAMRVMVLRIIEGASLVSLDFHYRERSESHLDILIRSPDGKEERFASDDLFDADVIRHMNMFKVSVGVPGSPGQPLPVLDGYSAFGVPEPEGR